MEPSNEVGCLPGEMEPASPQEVHEGEDDTCSIQEVEGVPLVVLGHHLQSAPSGDDLPPLRMRTHQKGCLRRRRLREAKAESAWYRRGNTCIDMCTSARESLSKGQAEV